MAGDWEGFALEKAELLSSRLKELLSSGQGYIQAQFGVDLGLKPELYPTWVILSTAAAGLLLLLCLSWAAAVCGRGGLLLFVGKTRRGSPVVVTQSGAEPVAKAGPVRSVKPEDEQQQQQQQQKKRNRKKTVEKEKVPEQAALAD